MNYISQDFNILYRNVYLIVLLLATLVHIIAALSVSKDIGDCSKHNIRIHLMPGFYWVISVLITGIWGLLIYWLIHHSNLSRE